MLLAITAHAFLGKLLYAEAGRLPPGTHYPAVEMEQAAQWMYYGGEIAELLLVAAFFTWRYRHPRRTPVSAAAAAAASPSRATLSARSVGPYSSRLAAQPVNAEP